MRRAQQILVLSLALILAAGAAGARETVVFLRHGEKPDAGLGQLTCQGLNRALKLPGALARAFYPDPGSPRPVAIFAPNPSDQKRDGSDSFDYVRPLATIEPTAVALGRPVDTQIGFGDTKGLQQALEKNRYRDALVIVAWEHHAILEVVRKLLKDRGGDPDKVPDWDKHDFDSLFVVTIDWEEGKASFERKSQGLNGLPESCPR